MSAGFQRNGKHVSDNSDLPTEDELSIIMRQHDMWLRTKKQGQPADFSGKDFSFNQTKQFRSINLSEATCKKTNFSGVDLENCNFTSATLWGATFSAATNLIGVNFVNAKMDKTTKFIDANLRYSIVRAQDFNDVDLLKTSRDKLPAALQELRDVQEKVRIREHKKWLEDYKKAGRNRGKSSTGNTRWDIDL